MTTNSRRVRLSMALVLAAALVAACGERSAHHARYRSGAPAAGNLVRGTVASVSSGDLELQTNAGTTTVKLMQPLHVYERAPATLADVKDGVFIGVTTVKQPDGSEQATEIHIFPEALRGLGEGSRMMAQSPGGGRMMNGATSGSRMTNGAVMGSRMTNGAVSGSRMTNGAVSQPRMSNGSVAGAKGTSLVVQYAGGSINVVVPPHTPVLQIKESSKGLAAGDQVVVPATRAPDGSLTTNKVLLSGK